MKKILILFFVITAQLQLSAGIVDPHILVIFGATGDLTQRKLLPALYHLSQKEGLPENFVCVALGRKKKTQEEYQENIRLALQNHLPSSVDEAHYSHFIKKCVYFQLDFESGDDYENLHNFLNELDIDYRTQGNRLFYLATPPSYFPTIVEQLHDHHLVDQDSSRWSRVLIEKPFGYNLESAIDLQKQICEYLDEEQIYLIDHYLGKEPIQNLLTLRFKNPLFEKIWNREFIEHIQITLSEDLGIGTRGSFWEETGLLRDVVQNHIMQLISLIAMERPETFEAKAISDQKVKVIQSIRPFSLDNLPQSIVRGQYAPGNIDGTEVKGYRQEDNVDSQSNVETFVAAKFWIDNERWKDVPFYLRAGKRLSQKLTEIVITFKDGFNRLIIRIQPNEEIDFIFNSNTPDGSIQPFNMHHQTQHRQPEAYENLLYESMVGDHKLFVSLNEILASWELFTPVLKFWKQYPPNDFPNYSPGSWGPEEASRLLQQENHEWYQLKRIHE